MSTKRLFVVDLDSSFFAGIARDATLEENKEAVDAGCEPNRPMSILGLTSDGLAAAEKEYAHLFAAAPELLTVAENLKVALEAREGYACAEYYNESNWNPLAHVEVTITVADIRLLYAAISKATAP